MSTPHQNPADRFIVGMSGEDAVIRQFLPIEHPRTTGLNRREAFDRALRRAWPNKHHRKAAGSVIFLGLDGNPREVASPADVQAHWMANRLNDPQTPAPVEAPASDEPSPERIAAVVTALREQSPNEFRDSLLSQFDRKGRLSLKQVEAVERGIAKRRENAKADGPIPEVPAGRYAVENEQGVLAFYVVDRPTEGRWAGYTFVRVMASDEEHRVSMRAAKPILAKIQSDPKAASARYGRELGVCGVCNRTLTDEASRAAGIGPVCADKAGW